MTAPQRPTLSGAFLQPTAEMNTQPPEAWDALLAGMRAIGLDTVVLQYCAYNGADLSPAAGSLLDAAARAGMRVWLGTPFDGTRWWNECWSPLFLATFAPAQAQAAYAAVAAFADHPALAGAYLPYETNGLSFPWAMGDFYGALSAAVKRAKPGLPVMISPYTNLVPGCVGSLPSWILTPWWETVLDRAKVDVMAFQDGVGACTAQLAEVSVDAQALGAAARSRGVAFWGNLEAFERTSPLDQPFEATAAPWGRYRLQLEAMAPWVEALITFDYNDYMAPTVGVNERRLYDAYAGYLHGPG